MPPVYRMMIVDDEPTVRFGLRSYFDWNAFGIEVAEEADDGDVALEALERVKPDIVLTDVRMPNLDGITLAKAIREQYPAVKIVFVSGHDDADYLKSALKVSAADYILKPVNLQELRTVVKRVVAELEAEQTERKLKHDMQLKLMESMPLLREKMLLSLIRDGVARPERVRERLEFLGLRLPTDASYWVMVISVDGYQTLLEDRTERDRQLICYAVQNVCQELVDRYFAGYAFEHRSGEFVAILQAEASEGTEVADDAEAAEGTEAADDAEAAEGTEAADDAEAAEDAEDADDAEDAEGAVSAEDVEAGDMEERLFALASDIRDNLLRWLQLGVTIGIGERVVGLPGLAHAYVQGREAADRKWYLGKNRIITMDSLDAEEEQFYRFGQGHGESLLSVLKGAEEEQVRAALDELFAGLARNRRDGFKYGRNVCLQIVLLAGQLLLELNVQSQELEEREAALWERLFKQETIGELRQLLETYLLVVCERIREKRSGKSSNVVERVRAIIERRYADNELTVAKIGQEVYLTDTYVSLLFKQETGKTVNEYLTHVRIEKAKELLRDPRNKFYDVCYAVGYADPSYFSKLFKKVTGLTPSAYRVQFP